MSYSKTLVSSNDRDNVMALRHDIKLLLLRRFYYSNEYCELKCLTDAIKGKSSSVDKEEKI